jgi:hypothetical protein
MRKATVTLLLLLVCATLAPANEVAFVETYDEALRLAGEKSQNLLITFYSDQ